MIHLRLFKDEIQNIQVHSRVHAMVSERRSILCLLVLVLLHGVSLAASPRYLSVSLDRLINSKAHVDCPPLAYPITSSGNKLPIRKHPCVCPPYCGGTKKTRRDVHGHDRARLTTLLQRSSVPVPPPIPAPAEAPSVTIPDRSGDFLDSPEFVVVVGFGTPTQPSSVMFDTGSDMSWIQCQPCSGYCHPQRDPVFDPARSTTYAVVPCAQPICSLAGSKCNGTTCLYSEDYVDGSSEWKTSGVLSQETLTLSSSSKLSGIPFGCGQQNLGKFGYVDGLLGLGRGQLSLSSHAMADHSFGGTFSYCLPSDNSTTGYLSIGSTPISGHVQYTAMIQKSSYPSLYFVELVSINIGGYILPVPPSIFTSTGTILDSGTILTHLPGQAYTALRDRFKFTMQGSKTAPPQENLDTCYDFAGQSTIFIPAVSLIFSDGAVFDLNFYGILTFPEPTIGCLAFMTRPASTPFSIIGNTQQRSTEVIYNVAAEKIGFVPNSC
ncbi:aspartyl protease family protein At5g10770-like [Hordeum vulgare subsp. vulgare]|uniref:aspartyl protease family protein At5g10770-like n=1 Tax=Hordeum vulgare subsp. vulgare TaxID=112509 RepID=UPI001D1A54F4|nr:aspartyl protease family protein At5g10770-like [Hordeum vulgare subsp. vulgare]